MKLDGKLGKQSERILATEVAIADGIVDIQLTEAA